MKEEYAWGLCLIFGVAVYLIHRKLNVIMEMLEVLRDRNNNNDDDE
jgi:hypothetical protein